MRKRDYLKWKKHYNRRIRRYRRSYIKLKRANLRKINKEMTERTKTHIKALNRAFYDGRYERKVK